MKIKQGKTIKKIATCILSSILVLTCAFPVSAFAAESDEIQLQQQTKQKDVTQVDSFNTSTLDETSKKETTIKQSNENVANDEIVDYGQDTQELNVVNSNINSDSRDVLFESLNEGVALIENRAASSKDFLGVQTSPSTLTWFTGSQVTVTATTPGPDY